MESVITLELDDDGETGVLGTRHVVCVERVDMGRCIVIEDPTTIPDDRECWGCHGWLDKEPLPPEETVMFTYLNTEDMPRDTVIGYEYSEPDEEMGGEFYQFRCAYHEKAEDWQGPYLRAITVADLEARTYKCDLLGCELSWPYVPPTKKDPR
jgi:hypothetical protein